MNGGVVFADTKCRHGVHQQRGDVFGGNVHTVVVARYVMAVVEVSTPREGIALVTLNRPDKLNAMTSEMVEALHHTLESIGKSRDVRVVVLTGAGRGFCAGLDLGGYGDAPGFEWRGSMEKGLAVQKHIASLIPRLRSLPQPVIAAVNGPASGGGFALVLGSDVRLCAQSAKFNAAFIRIGLSACDIGTSWLLPRLIGASRAQELMLTGRLITAEEAARIGLVVESFPDDVLLDAAFAKADEIMQNTPIGVALTKEGMWSALEIPGLQAAIDLENRQQIMASFSDDAREMRRARQEGRPPTFHA
jgi:enoyl-CoA hydratase